MVRENDVQENRPPISFNTQSEPVPEEMWFQGQGIDTTSPKYQELQHFFKPLNKFSSDWMNGVLTAEATELILPPLQETYTAIKRDTEADKNRIDLLWHKLTACVAILGRIANNLESDSLTFCRQVLLEGAKHEQSKPDPRYDDEFDFLGYSAYPRHEAAAGLLRLAFHQSDAKILDAIETLANDPMPSVRMVTAIELFQVYDKAPEKFWYIVDSRATQEKNLVVQEYLYLTLTQVVGKAKENEDKTTCVMAKLLEHTPLSPGKLASFDPLSLSYTSLKKDIITLYICSRLP